MYNLQTKFNTFYKKHVVLPKAEKNALFSKKKLNVDRLKEGLKEYNEEKGTDYKLAEEALVQGSVAMATVIQNQKNDYDIDVAIIFEKDNLPSGTTATKNMIVNALERKCTQFKEGPEAKTNCVRIIYKANYHIDFAIYRRYKNDNDEYIYEHCGSEWRERNPRAITNWFIEQEKEHDYKLRQVVRLLKMFSKSRDSWKNMPGGLIQSVLADEQFQKYDRIDERFYYTIKAIKDRLFVNKDVYNPTDSTKSLKLVSKDNAKMDNLYNRLNDELSELEILFDEKCTYNQAVEAWGEFFNHTYWEGQKKVENSSLLKSYAGLQESEVFFEYKETEEFIHNIFPVNIQYPINLNCEVKQKQRASGWLLTMINMGQHLRVECELNFVASTNIPTPYDVYWKVKNSGELAKKGDCVRGDIVKTNSLSHFEVTSFAGEHFVECYIVKSGVCVARKRIPVHIIA